MVRTLPLLALLAACAPASVSSITQDAGAATDQGGAVNPTDATAGADARLAAEPAWVAVDVRTGAPCDPVSACGGDVRGTWDVAGACIEVPLDESLMRCPGAMVTRRGGRARGRVTFGERIARRRAEWSAEVETLIPAVCASFVGGCPGIQASVRLINPDTTCEARPSGDCRCLARTAGVIDDGDGYSTDRGQIISSTLRRRWDYCVSDGALRYRDVSAIGPREPGVITLRRAE